MAYFMPSHPKHGLRTSADELQCTRRQSVELLTHGLTIFRGGGGGGGDVLHDTSDLGETFAWP